MEGLVETLKRGMSGATHRLQSMPIVTLMAHSACNCRCVMCDIWKANAERREISEALLARHVDDLRALRVRRVVLSGGEALLHSNLWALCKQLHELPAHVTLLSTGMLLGRHANDVATHCDEVIVSLDGTPALHDAIRNVPRAFDRLADGVRRLREVAPVMAISARCVIHRGNFAALAEIVETARGLPLDRISFLAADLTSEAFNRPQAWDAERASEVALDAGEVTELRERIEALRQSHADDFTNGFIAESPEKLARIADHYGAHLGLCAPPPVRCNAPWVSSVVEADGSVRPCFFHRTFGSIEERPLREIVNSPEMVAFRRGLDVNQDPICRRCVCTLELRPWVEVVGR